MPGSDPVKVNRAQRTRYRRVMQARELIEKNSKAIAQTLVNKAKDGDVRTARWLLEHTAAKDIDGTEARPIAEGVDARGGNRDTPGAADSAPRILIGVALGQDFARLNAQQTAIPADRQLAPAALPQSVSAHTVDAQIIKENEAGRVRASQKARE